jgi:hypothetical protein
MKAQLIIFCISIFLLNGCSKDDETIELNDRSGWSKHDGFLNTRSILNNMSTDGMNLYVLGHNRISIIRNSISDPIDHYLLDFLNPVFNRLPVSPDLFISLVGDQSFFVDDPIISFQYTQLPLEPQCRLLVDLAEIDSTFARFDIRGFTAGNAIVLNDKLQCLLPYFVYEGASSISLTPHFFLFQMALEGNAVIKVPSILSVDRLKLDASDGSLTNLNTVEDMIFISSTNATHKIDQNNDLVRVSSVKVNRIFRLEGDLYGLNNSNLYRSTDDGDSWVEQGLISEDFAKLNFVDIAGHLIGYQNSNLYHVQLENEQLSAIELQNNGLEGNEITSICVYDDHVMISTLSGMFYNHLDTFLRYK